MPTQPPSQSTRRAANLTDSLCACVQGGAAAASGKIQVGDHLVSVGGTQVLGKDIDKVLAVVGGVAEVGHRQRERRRDFKNTQMYMGFVMEMEMGQGKG